MTEREFLAEKRRLAAEAKAEELEAQLAEASADAERNIGVLKRQLANCHETMRKDGVRHAKLLLAVEDDAARIERLEAALRQVEWTGAIGLEVCVWCWNHKHDGHKPNCARQLALAPDAERPDCDHPFRVTGDVCLNCGAPHE